MMAFAIRYARAGYKVMPLLGKLPRTKHGLVDASGDTRVIEAWWKRWPDANIGIACAASGVVVLDIDPRNGGVRPAWAVPTLEASTGGGGQHLIYRAPPDCNPPGSVGPGLDVKYRGYIVAPPSVHPNGTPYRWSRSSVPVPAPARLVVREERPPVVAAVVAQDRYVRAAVRRAAERIQAAGYGDQERTLNNEAFSLGRLVKAGQLGFQEACAALVAAGLNMINHDPRRPWTLREVQSKVERGLRR